MTASDVHDSLYRLAQIGTSLGVQLVRLIRCEAHNRYAAVPVEFDADGATQPADDAELTVLNLAEPADAAGTLPAGTDAVAIDVEGRWVAFVRPAAQGASSLPARITASLGGAAYTVLPQVCADQANFQPQPGAAAVTAVNLAELSLGSGAAVDVGTLVLLTSLTDSVGATRYVFDHPAYAKYLD